MQNNSPQPPRLPALPLGYQRLPLHKLCPQLPFHTPRHSEPEKPRHDRGSEINFRHRPDHYPQPTPQNHPTRLPPPLSPTPVLLLPEQLPYPVSSDKSLCRQNLP